MKNYCYITFPSTYYAFRAESIIKKSGLKIKMVPVPRKISTSCGTSMRCSPTEKDTVIAKLLEEKIAVEGTHVI